MDSLVTKIYNEFRKAVINEFSNRVSSITDVNYGKKKQTKPSLKYSKEDVYKISQKIIVEVIQKYLPNRTIQTSTQVEPVFDASQDTLSTVVRRRESDVTIQPKVPQVNVTKEKPPKPVEEKQLEKQIMEEVPSELPVPKFSKPNPIKSTKTPKGLGNLFGRKRNRKLDRL